MLFEYISDFFSELHAITRPHVIILHLERICFVNENSDFVYLQFTLPHKRNYGRKL